MNVNPLADDSVLVLYSKLPIREFAHAITRERGLDENRYTKLYQIVELFCKEDVERAYEPRYTVYYRLNTQLSKSLELSISKLAIIPTAQPSNPACKTIQAEARIWHRLLDTDGHHYQ